MAAGVPVVATNVPGCRDLIRPGETGWSVRAGDPAEIARGIQAALSDEQSSRRMARAAQTWVREKLGVTGWSERWLKLYHSVLSQ
jgi:glycosyltransferase involved in cell wall biosynthesis